MPIVKFRDVLHRAEQTKTAVAGFNLSNYEGIKWAVEVAEELNAPVMLMLYAAQAAYIPVSTFAAIAHDLAAKSDAEIVLHLDHARTYEEAVSALQYRFSSIMFDGSQLPFEENLRITKEVVAAGHAMGTDVEAELGYVGRAEKLEDFTLAESYTNPDQAEQFVRETQCDALAIAIGNAHGMYVQEPHLDQQRLAEVRNRINGVPIVLHGGSGIPDEQIREAVKNGIRKLNVGTNVGRAMNEGFHKSTEDKEKPAISFAEAEVKQVMRGRIELLR